jgi:hypothetical protein
MQIKCNKCGQSFSTVTSLSKHKRFCDSTGSGASNQSTAQQSSQQQIPSAMTTPPNPYLMLRNHPSFFPPGFSPFPGLQGIFPPSSAQAPHFPLLFPKHSFEMPSMDVVDRKTPTKLGMTQSHSNGRKLSPSQADEASSNAKPSPARPQPLSIQNLINKHDKNMNNNSTVNNLNHSNNYVKREFIKSEDDEAASPNRRNHSARMKDERNGTKAAKNGMDHFSRKRSFSMDTSNEIKSNNQSDADIKVRFFFFSSRVSFSLQNVCFFSTPSTRAPPFLDSYFFRGSARRAPLWLTFFSIRLRLLFFELTCNVIVFDILC